MSPNVSKWLNQADCDLSIAKLNLLHDAFHQNDGTCSCCNAVKEFLIAYNLYLNNEEITGDFDILIASIDKKDHTIVMYKNAITEIKSIGLRSKQMADKFFLLDEEINKVMHTALDIRQYVTSKMDMPLVFMGDFINSHYSN